MGNISIIGAGPAGLMAADILSALGHAVTLYDHKASVARKFLMAGRGGLNITHSEPFETFLTRYGTAADHLRPALQSFTPDDLRAWCAALGEDTFIGTSGRVFPKSFKASPLLRAWMARLTSQHVTFAPNHHWAGWSTSGELVFTENDVQKTIRPDATIFALGGASWPKLGSDGTWVSLFQKRGLTVAPLRPANCGFVVAWSPFFRDKFAGIPLKSITLTVLDKTITGEAMVTQSGIEGGGIYALSAILRDEIDHHGAAALTLDFKPDMDEDVITRILKHPHGRDSLGNFLRKKLSLPPVVIGLLNEDRHLNTLTPAQLAARIKHYPLTLTATFPIDRAISSAGGIQWDQIDQNYMVKSIPGTFVCGEMLDWEAPTGGYLLQATFSTAHYAAHALHEWLKSLNHLA